MPKLRTFSREVILAKPLPEPGKRIRYGDHKVRGLCVLVTGGGARSYYLYRKFDGRLVEERLGFFDELSVPEARRMAEELIADILRGRDLQKERRERRTRLTLAELCDWYLKTKGKEHKDGGKLAARYFRNYLGATGKRVAATLKRSELISLRDAIGKESGPDQADRVIGMVKAVYNYAIENQQHGIENNPAANIPRLGSSEGRHRRLEYLEAPALFKVLQETHLDDARRLILLGLFTGMRKDNILGIRWDWIDEQTKAITIPAEEFKSNRVHVVPLIPQAWELLQNFRNATPWVFPLRRGEGRRTREPKGVADIFEAAKLADFTIHDLRRTCSTYMGEAGVDQRIIDAVLGHSDNKVSSRYNRPGLEARREALQRGVNLMLEKAGMV